MTTTYQLVGYHRPTTMAHAVGLLVDGHRRVLGGGTTFRHDGGGTPTEVVDLQALGLDEIADDGDRVRLGAMATLQGVADDPRVPDLIRRCATAELPSTLRTLGTVGGTVGAREPESVLLAALLVHGAVCTGADESVEPLDRVLLPDGLPASHLVVDVAVETGGVTAMAVAGRTPADVPIVAALARRAGDDVRLALTGVASTPVVVEAEAIGSLDPPSDFRGSAEYRRHLAGVLSARVLEEVS